MQSIEIKQNSYPFLQPSPKNHYYSAIVNYKLRARPDLQYMEVPCMDKDKLVDCVKKWQKQAPYLKRTFDNRTQAFFIIQGEVLARQDPHMTGLCRFDLPSRL